MSAPYVDGLYPSGAPIITMGAFTYRANKLSFNRTTETVNITDPDGEHAGAISFTGPITGSIEVQYAAANTPDPNVASVNAVTGVFLLSINNTNTNCFVTSVDIEKPQRGPWTATLAFQVKDN